MTPVTGNHRAVKHNVTISIMNSNNKDRIKRPTTEYKVSTQTIKIQNHNNKIQNYYSLIYRFILSFTDKLPTQVII